MFDAQHLIDLLIMGWRGRPSSSVFAFGSTVDPVMELAPCDVLVLKDCGGQKFRRILVPVVGGPNAALALRVAAILAEHSNGEAVAFSVDTGNARRTFDLDAFVVNFAFSRPDVVWFNNGSGSFSAQTLSNTNSVDVALGDVAGDGDLDAMAAANN